MQKKAMRAKEYLLEGLVRQSTGSWCVVEAIESGRSVEARMRGKLKLGNEASSLAHPICVGDRVWLLRKEEDYIIQAIQERKNQFTRRIERIGRDQIMASNLDQILIIACLKDPYVPLLFIDTLIAAAKIEGISPIVIFTKKDSYGEQEMKKIERIQSIYAPMNCPTFPISIYDGSVSTLYPALAKKTSLLVGFSGSGKSSLIQTLIPHASLKIQELSKTHYSGMHTTTCSATYELGEGGFLIDSPGVRSFSLSLIDHTQLRMYFDDFLPYQEKCDFVSCTHMHEEKCAVKKAVEEGHIFKERRYSYTHLFDYLKSINQKKYAK